MRKLFFHLTQRRETCSFLPSFFFPLLKHTFKKNTTELNQDSSRMERDRWSHTEQRHPLNAETGHYICPFESDSDKCYVLVELTVPAFSVWLSRTSPGLKEQSLFSATWWRHDPPFLASYVFPLLNLWRSGSQTKFGTKTDQLRLLKVQDFSGMKVREVD